MTVRVYPTGERKVIYRPSAPLEPCQQTRSGICCDFELDRSSRFLLDHHRTRSDIRTYHQCADLRLHQIAPSQLAIDGEVEQGSVSHTPLAIKEEADRPNLPGLQSALGSDLPAGVPGRAASSCRIIM
jgi:hypothetical protein